MRTTSTSPFLVLLFVHTNKIFIITWPLNINNLSDLIDIIYHPYFLQHHYHRIAKPENNSVHCVSCLYLLTISYFIIHYLHSIARITNCTCDYKWLENLTGFLSNTQAISKWYKLCKAWTFRRTNYCLFYISPRKQLKYAGFEHSK